jgi:hypothetical protein
VSSLASRKASHPFPLVEGTECARLATSAIHGVTSHSLPIVFPFTGFPPLQPVFLFTSVYTVLPIFGHTMS